jgi:hypothetical protein
MSAAASDIEVDQGATYIDFIDCFDDDAQLIPSDLTGYLGRGQVKAKATDLEPLAAFDVLVGTGPANRVQYTLTASASSAIPTKGASYKFPTLLVYDIEIYKVDDVIRLVNGQMSLSPEVTK